MKRLALILVVPILASCSGNPNGAPAAPPAAPAGPTPPVSSTGVMDTTWRLQAIERVGASAITVTAPDRYTLRLDPSGRASVRADCNACGGGYALDGDKLTFTPMACTLVGCPPDSLDAPFLSVLGTESRLVQSGDTLSLTSAAGTLRFAR